MRILFAAAAAALVATFAASCSQTQPTMATMSSAPGASDAERALCRGSSAPRCRFVNSPVRLAPEPVRLPRRPLVFYPTAEPLAFVDGRGREWVAPERTLTDGASIPRAFISIIGAPKSREFANAGAMHDAYCGIGNEAGPNYHAAPWREVHRMFYDALRVGGTPEIKAKVMYASVYLGGPRWPQGEGGAAAPRLSSRGGTTGAATSADTAPAEMLSVPTLRRIMRRTQGQIETARPSLSQIESFIDAEVQQAVRQAMQAGGHGGADHAEQPEPEPEPEPDETGSETGSPAQPAGSTDPAGPGTDPATGPDIGAGAEI